MIGLATIKPSRAVDAVPTVIPSFVPPQKAVALCERALGVISDIHLDHFADLDENEFIRQHVDHASPVMRAASYRFASRTTVDALLHSVRQYLSNQSIDTPFLLHPIFYLRFSNSQNKSSAAQSIALLEGQPHYDLALGIPAYSFWLALLPRTKESGGICTFNITPQLYDAFRVNQKGLNAYNYEGYVAAAQYLDPLLKDQIVEPELQAGDAFLFDNSVLHAATRGTGGVRLSFDFRIILANDLLALRDPIRQLVEEFNEDPEKCNRANLQSLGDFSGADPTRYSSAKRAGNPSATPTCSAQFKQPNTVIRYQQEYNWAKF
jgi:hypothetical protein